MPEGLEQPLPLLDRGLALEHGRVEPLAEVVELVDVLADDERRLAPVLRDEALDDLGLLRRGRAEPVALLGLGGRVQQPLRARAA